MSRTQKGPVNILRYKLVSQCHHFAVHCGSPSGKWKQQKLHLGWLLHWMSWGHPPPSQGAISSRSSKSITQALARLVVEVQVKSSPLGTKHVTRDWLHLWVLPSPAERQIGRTLSLLPAQSLTMMASPGSNSSLQTPFLSRKIHS